MPSPPTSNQLSDHLKSAASQANIGLWQEIIQHGYVLVDTMYQPHPIWRPFDVFHRWAARRWWAQQVRLSSQQLALSMVKAATKSFDTQLNRPLQREEMDFQEEMRQRRVTFDIDQQIRLAKATAKAQARAQAGLQQQQADLTRPPDPMAHINAILAKMMEIENDPNLSDDQKQRRLALLREQQQVFGPGRK